MPAVLEAVHQAVWHRWPRHTLPHRANVHARLPQIHPLRRDGQLLHAQREETSRGRAHRRRGYPVSRDAPTNQKKRVIVPAEEGVSLLDSSSPGIECGDICKLESEKLYRGCGVASGANCCEISVCLLVLRLICCGRTIIKNPEPIQFPCVL